MRQRTTKLATVYSAAEPHVFNWLRVLTNCLAQLRGSRFLAPEELGRGIAALMGEQPGRQERLFYEFDHSGC